MNKPYVFHLKREFFDMIKSGSKTCECRFNIPEGFSRGARIRFDLGYKSLKDKSAHLYAVCTAFERVPLRSCLSMFFRCFGIDPFLVVCPNALIYRISFVLDGAV